MQSEKQALVISVTLYSTKVPNKKMSSQHFSTVMNLAYYCADNPLDPNDKCLVQRAAWEAKKLHEVNAVRVSVLCLILILLLFEGCLALPMISWLMWIERTLISCWES